MSDELMKGIAIGEIIMVALYAFYHLMFWIGLNYERSKSLFKKSEPRDRCPTCGHKV